MVLSRAPRPLEVERPRRPNVENAGDEEQLLVHGRFELLPQLVGAQQQRHVARVLVVGLADDARLPMGAAQLVRDAELLQTEHPRAALG